MSLFAILNANRGGAGGIGHKAATAALNAGYSREQIANELGSEAVKSAQREAGVSETNTSLMGDLAATSIGNRFGGQHFGHADVAAARDQGHSELAIANYIANTAGALNTAEVSKAGSSYGQLMTNVALGAGMEQAAANAATQSQNISNLSGQVGQWESKYGNLKNQYDTLSGKYDTAITTAQQAKEESMKIKYTGSTAVQNPSAMGIKQAQGTPFKGSGMAGAAALARPNKGMKIRTLNV